MRRTKTLGLLVCTTLALLAIPAAASAFTLPDMHTALPNETYPIVLSGEVKAEAGNEKEIHLENEVSSIPATLVSVLMIASELTSLGSVQIDFTGLHENKKPLETCNTEGDGAGVVLVPFAEYHLVDLGLEPNLKLGLLILFPTFSVTCKGGLKVKVEAPDLSAVDLVEEADIESATALTHCKAGSPGIAANSSFVNEAGEQGKETALLKANFGAGNTNACEEITKPLPLTIETAFSLAKMFTILF
jgi:hypothetical protein